jgi:aldose sugar dehydrogenase
MRDADMVPCAINEYGFLMRSVRLRNLALAGALLAAACGGQAPPTSPPGSGSSPGSPISIVGTERIGWDQAASDAAEAASYEYTLYVDDALHVRNDAVCQSGSAPTIFACSASLPPMSVGLHRLEFTARVPDGLESGKSAALYVLVAAVKPAVVVSAGPRVTTTHDGTRFAIETLATGLDAPSALAVLADGRVFIAQKSGDVLVWQGGQILSVPAGKLGDAARTPEVGLIGMTLHPDFATNGRVLVAYTARDRDGTFVNRIARFRALNNVFGEAVVILEDRVAVAPQRPPRIRFGPDRKVYAAFSAADQATAESFASYAGKILRINEDGTTPRDNPKASPIISTGHPTPGGFDWQPTSGRLWLVERDPQGRDVLRAFSSSFETAVTFPFDSAIAASGATFYNRSALTGFANDLFIGGLVGQHLRRVHFDLHDDSRIETTERLLDGQYGRIGDVATGPDGALYICTNNGGSDLAAAGDDRLLRLIPVKQ